MDRVNLGRHVALRHWLENCVRTDDGISEKVTLISSDGQSIGINSDPLSIPLMKKAKMAVISNDGHTFVTRFAGTCCDMNSHQSLNPSNDPYLKQGLILRGSVMPTSDSDHMSWYQFN